MSSTGRGPRLGGQEDFYVTPAWCVDRLLEVWHPTERGTWLEPAAGNGAIIRAAKALRPDVYWAAVEVREEERAALAATGATVQIGDFLEAAPISDVSAVIGNPPFAMAMEFVQRALAVYPNARVAFLLRLNFAGSEERGAFMRRFPPTVYVLPNRPAFANGKTDSCEYAWFAWPRGEHRERDDGHFRVLASTPKGERTAKAAEHRPLFGGAV